LDFVSLRTQRVMKNRRGNRKKKRVKKPQNDELTKDPKKSGLLVVSVLTAGPADEKRGSGTRWEGGTFYWGKKHVH